KLKANVRSLQQATRNANDWISLIQTAEGSMNEISNILIRWRELSMQAASDTTGDIERSFVEEEVQHLNQELDRISAATEYDGTKLLDGSAPVLEFQVGLHNDPVKDRLNFDSSDLVTSLESLGLESISVLSKEESQNNLEGIDAAISKLNDNRSSLGA